MSPLALLAFAYFFAFASGGLQLPLTAPAMTGVGLSLSDVGLMWAARSVGSVLAPAIWGVVADRRGDARKLAALALALGCGLLMLLTVLHTKWWAVLLFGLFGLLTSPSGSMLDGMVLMVLGEARHRFGRVRAFGTLGFGVTCLLSTWALEKGVFVTSPTSVFAAAAVCSALGCAAVLVLPPMPRAQAPAAGTSWRLLLRRDVLELFLVGGVLWASHAAYTSFLMPLTTQAGLPTWTVGVSITAGIVVEIVVFRFSEPWFVRLGATTLVRVAAVVAVLRWLLLAVVASPVLVVALHALHGVTFGLMFTALVALVAERVPDALRQTGQASLSATSFGIGGACGSLVVGPVLTSWGVSATWCTMAAIALLGTALAWRVTSKPREPASR